MISSEKVSVFIGSSREGLGIAQAIQLELEEDAICTIWYQGIFGLSQGTLESLEEALPTFEFAILVLSPDDVVIARENKSQIPRDNVLFELGLFMGHLGRRRVFVVYCDDGNTKLPSDLAGITIARFNKPNDGKLIQEYSINDVLPRIGPVVSKMRAAIQDIQKSKPREIIIHYIPPTLSRNDYYTHFQNCLETELSKLQHISWHYCPPKGDTPHDIYLELQNILQTIRSHDIVVLVPKDLYNPQMSKLVQEILSQQSSGKIIFIDEKPPPQFLDMERISFIGVDDHKVGLLAAFALHNKLKDLENTIYCVIDGPGGYLRTQGFLNGIRHFNPLSEVEIFDFGDIDRIESLPHLKQIIESCPKETSLGIFAGNDETAFAVFHALEYCEPRLAFVVGCDATREMRLAIDSGKTNVISTIDTDLRSQAKKILQAVKAKTIELQEPKLYPMSLQIKMLLRDPGFRELWESSQ